MTPCHDVLERVQRSEPLEGGLQGERRATAVVAWRARNLRGIACWVRVGPKLDLVRVEGITELQELRADLSERTAGPSIFSRTAAGLIAFTKVRLEVYAVPMRWSEQLICSQEVIGCAGGAIPTRCRIRSVAHARFCVG